MISHFVKITIFTTTLVLFGALEQRPLWAFNNTYVPVTSSNNADEATDTSTFAGNDLLLRATRNLEMMNFKSETTDEAIGNTNYYYRPNSITENHTIVSAAPLSTYIRPYSNRWAKLSSSLPTKRKVPEPSIILGLIAIAASLKMQRQIKKS